jgi:hypothetical protein
VWSPFLSVLGMGATAFVYNGRFHPETYLELLLPIQDHSLVYITNVLVPFVNGHTPIHVNALLLLDCLLYLMYVKEYDQLKKFIVAGHKEDWVSIEDEKEKVSDDLKYITNVLVPFVNGHTPIHVNALLLLDCLLYLMYKKESPKFDSLTKEFENVKEYDQLKKFIVAGHKEDWVSIEDENL